MAYNPGGQPPFNQQPPFGVPPPPPPKQGMSTGVKVAIFGCIGLIFLAAIIAVVAIVVGVSLAPGNSNILSSGSNSSSAPSTRNDSTSSSNTSSTNSSAPTSSDTAGVNVTSIELATDNNGQPGDTVSSFEPTDNPMHFVIRLDDAVAGTKVRVVLKAVSVDTGDKDVTVGQLEYTTKSFESRVNAQFELPKPWPKGSWRLEVYINGKLDETKDFNVV